MTVEEFFSEPALTGRCVVCDEILYNNDGYIASNTDDMLCSYKCVIKFLDLKCDDDERFEDTTCVRCGEDVSDDFESVTVEDERFCSEICALIHSGIQ